jgi:hypothetical protein
VSAVPDDRSDFEPYLRWVKDLIERRRKMPVDRQEIFREAYLMALRDAGHKFRDRTP